MPVVSVIMPVYNAEKFIKETIESILNQTFGDFEFLIADDGSTDKSLDIINSYLDPRIKVYVNESNIGYVATLNNLINASKGEYIARQDNDDISDPRRLELQVRYLKSHPNVGICGSDAIYFGTRKGRISKANKNKDIKAHMIFNNQIIHPSVLMRSSIFRGDNALSYNKEFCPAEDYKLWFDISKAHEITNLKVPLLKYRWHEKNQSQLQERIQTNKANQIRHIIIEDTLLLKLSDEGKHICDFISRNDLTIKEFVLYERWLNKIFDLNIIHNYYDQKSLEKSIFDNWSYVSRNNNNISPFHMLRVYYSSNLYQLKWVFSKNSIKTTIKNLIRIIK